MQKAAYEMRMSDWSSDVCSTDLGVESPFRSRQDDAHVPDPAEIDRQPAIARHYAGRNGGAALHQRRHGGMRLGDVARLGAGFPAQIRPSATSTARRTARCRPFGMAPDFADAVAPIDTFRILQIGRAHV